MRPPAGSSCNNALDRRRARRDPNSPLVFHRDGIPVRRWRTAWRTACQAAGVPTRFLHDCRRTAARNLIRASVPERVAMLLTGHKSRAIFDRYNIIHEQELLDAADQLSPISRSRRRRHQPVGGPTRPAPPPRARRRPSASCDAPPRKGARYAREPGGGGPTPAVYAPQVASRPTRTGWPVIVAHVGDDGAGRRDRTRARAGPDRASRPGGPEAPTLFSEICKLIVLGAVHPASDGEYEKVQRIRHVLS